MSGGLEVTEPPAAKAAAPLVLLHGLLSTPREFSLIAPLLQANGRSMIAPTIAGYTEARDRRRVRWRSWLDEAEVAVREQVRLAGRDCALGGMCSGGLLAAALVIEGRLPARSLVLMSPTFAFDGWGRTALWRWRHLAYGLGVSGWFSVNERSPYGVKDVRIRAWIESDMKRRQRSAAGPLALPLWAVHETEKLADYVRRRIGDIRVPMLVIHSREDEVCRLRTVRRVLAGTDPSRTALRVLENSFHMITLDHDRRQVAAELRDFVDWSA